MENGEIRDDQITSSSQKNEKVRAAYGRLNFKAIANSDVMGAWGSATSDLNQLLQVDFKRFAIITGVSTQGRQEYDNFVKSYTISFSDDGGNFHGYKVGEVLKVR